MKALLATKLRNELLAIKSDLQVQLRNVDVNGIKMGCSGFITDPATGRVVYVNTDHNHGTNFDRAYFRVAREAKDYRGGRNHFSGYTELADAAAELLKSTNFDRELAAR
ncbi:hypothetical protein [Arthrobacter sp. ES1]|uniref:hypothetical protein n=1 Tax=Arthrobacter sp. ES1 TaxID=1897056 RepID=UPI001CFF9C90|nr:hypothetical protein [Arthrobacter sp. ES1]MCB5280465.1 hypothetical protein [Arthrobacter sp. ES1]